jgi:Na+:H+ antiporter
MRVAGPGSLAVIGEPMHEIILLVLGIAALLFLTALLLPTAQKGKIPFSVLLALLGLLIGVTLRYTRDAAIPGFIGDLFQSFDSFSVTSDVIFFVFLPTLVFESALSIDARSLMRDLGPILFLAIIGLLISTVIVGLSLWQVTSYGLVVCLLVGSVVSATDPAAVIALFKDLGAPNRLALLVEGESLMNDATAIVSFTLLLGMITGASHPDILIGVVDFFYVFLGGALLGAVMARFVLALLADLDDFPMVENTLTVSLAYLSFVVAEYYLEVSGVMAVVTAGLMVGARGRTVMSKTGWIAQTSLWERLGFWANSLIFVLAGMALSDVQEIASVDLLVPIAVLIVSAFAARFVILFFILPALSRFGGGFVVSKAYRAVMFWGGLRGAVSLALALYVLEQPDLPQDVKVFVAALVASLVMFTLFVNATTIRPVMAAFGLDELAPTDLALRQRVLVDALSSVRREMSAEARNREVDLDSAELLEQEYDDRIAAISRDESVQDLDGETWQTVALLMLLRLERHMHTHRMDQELVSSDTTRNLLSANSRLQDAVRDAGLSGYLRAVRHEADYPQALRRAVWIQRHIGWPRPLAQELAQRFANLQAEQTVLKDLAEHHLDDLCELIDSTRQQELRRAVEVHRRAVHQALEALEAQYPEYAGSLRFNLLELVALRQEQDRYAQMFSEGLIGQELHNDLMVDIADRRDDAQRNPPLDLGLEPEKLVEQVELFHDLPEDAIERIVEMLRPRLALPGEMIVRRGDQGDSMYFISSGAAEVALDGGDLITLGSGEFFGELALITDQPRSADVRAISFTDLLELKRRDFQELLSQDDTIRRGIETVARERTRPVEEEEAPGP